MWNHIKTYLKSAYNCKNFDVEKFNAWVKDKDIMSWDSTGHTDVPHLIKNNRFKRPFMGMENVVPPRMDHVACFRSAKKNKTWFVSQPYHGMEIKEEMEAWAEEHGLKVEVSLNAWFDETTVLVVFTTL